MDYMDSKHCCDLTLPLCVLVTSVVSEKCTSEPLDRPVQCGDVCELPKIDSSQTSLHFAQSDLKVLFTEATRTCKYTWCWWNMGQYLLIPGVHK